MSELKLVLIIIMIISLLSETRSSIDGNDKQGTSKDNYDRKLLKTVPRKKYIYRTHSPTRRPTRLKNPKSSPTKMPTLQPISVPSSKPSETSTITYPTQLSWVQVGDIYGGIYAAKSFNFIVSYSHGNPGDPASGIWLSNDRCRTWSRKLNGNYYFGTSPPTEDGRIVACKKL